LVLPKNTMRYFTIKLFAFLELMREFSFILHSLKTFNKRIFKIEIEIENLEITTKQSRLVK